MAVSFSYSFDLYQQISDVRLLIADTNPAEAIFGDDEISAAIRMQTSLFRAAALLLDAQAAHIARNTVTTLLDVTRNPMGAAAALREQAKQYREMDDDQIAFTILRLRGGMRVSSLVSLPDPII